MIRRLNYTGRRRIQRSRITIRLHPGETADYRFVAEYDLAGLDFPPNARVKIEAYSMASYMRFDFGTVDTSNSPRDTDLVDVLSHPLPKFRLKVVDVSQQYGLLLGVADKLIPLRPDEQLEQRQSLLPVDFCDLGERAWRLQLGDWPVLELNNRIDNIAEAARSSGSFLGLLYPEVLRRVLRYVLIDEGITDPGFDDSEWTSLWLRFACSLPGVEEPPQDAGDSFEVGAEEWIETVVQAFCRSRQARARLESAIESELC